MDIIFQRDFELDGCDYKLTVYDTFKTDSQGTSRNLIRYVWEDKTGEVIFDNECAVPGDVSIDSLESIRACLVWISLRKGDTDKEFFSSYTDLQLEWSESTACEQLSGMVSQETLGWLSEEGQE